jgi:HEAT repeat protein
VVSALIQALGDQDVYVRQTAVLALKRIGSEVMAAVPALIQALQDKSDRVRGYAAEALEAITGQQFGQDAARWQQWWNEQQR